MMLFTCSNSTTVLNCQIFAVLNVKLSTLNRQIPAGNYLIVALLNKTVPKSIELFHVAQMRQKNQGVSITKKKF